MCVDWFCGSQYRKTPFQPVCPEFLLQELIRVLVWTFLVVSGVDDIWAPTSAS